jgi:hypothetical protein
MMSLPIVPEPISFLIARVGNGYQVHEYRFQSGGTGLSIPANLQAMAHHEELFDFAGHHDLLNEILSRRRVVITLTMPAYLRYVDEEGTLFFNPAEPLDLVNETSASNLSSSVLMALDQQRQQSVKVREFSSSESVPMDWIQMFEVTCEGRRVTNDVDRISAMLGNLDSNSLKWAVAERSASPFLSWK